MAESCDINDRKSDIACYVNCLSISEMQSIRLYLLVMTLIANDPTYAAYTLEDWKELLKGWQGLTVIEREALRLQLALELAQAAGTRDTNDLDQLRSDSKCYFCLAEDTRLNLLAGIECYLSIPVVQ